MKSKNETKTKILIISFYFPPTTKAGGKRFSFLSEFFVKQYDDLHILTVKDKYISPKDYSLSGAGTIHRSGMFPPYPPINEEKILIRALRRLWEDYLCILDPFIGWIFPAVIKGLKVIRNHRINLIISTGPPFTAMVIGFLLSRMTGAKLILDYRDPWSNYNRRFFKALGKKIGRFLEKLVVKKASSLVFCSPIMKNDFLDSLGKYTKASCHVVTNGFNKNDKINGISLGQTKKKMIYTGNFYGERRIGLLANALLSLLTKGLIADDTFCLHVFGKIKKEDKEIIWNNCLQNIIIEHPTASYDKMIRYLRDADLLLLISGSDVNYAIPYKLFDYLSVKRPIFAVAPENSAVADIMKKIDCGRFANIKSEKSILENLRMMLFVEEQYTFKGAELYTWDKIGNMYINVIEQLEN
jgi:glycosyltransferase involved in cell wall biosynthesis